MADRFPFTPEDRVRAVGVVNDALQDGDNWRTKLGAVRAFAELERLNLAEVAMAINATKDAPQITNNVNVSQAVQVNGSNGISLDDFKRLPADEQQRLLREATAASSGNRGPGAAGV